MEVRGRPEQLTAALAQIDPNDPQKMTKMYGLITELGEPTQQIAAMSKMQELAKSQKALEERQKYKQGLITTASKLGLENASDRVLGANDNELRDFAKEITERQIKLASKGDDDSATIAYFATAGINEQDLKVQYGNNLENMPSFENSVEIVKGGQVGDIEAFLDAEGKITTYSTLGNKIKIPKTNTDGTVSYEWVDATESGLEKAPQVIKQLSTDNTIRKGLAEAEVKNFVELHDKASMATQTVAQARQALALLPYINTGMLAEGITAVQKIAKLLGASDNVTASAAASEKYFSNRGMEFANFVKNFGSGNGITNFDVENAEKITAGKLTMDDRALRKILEDSIIVSENLFEQHGAKMDDFARRGVVEAEGFNLPPIAKLTFDPASFSRVENDSSVYEPTPETKNYLEQANQRLGNE